MCAAAMLEMAMQLDPHDAWTVRRLAQVLQDRDLGVAELLLLRSKDMLESEDGGGGDPTPRTLRGDMWPETSRAGTTVIGAAGGNEEEEESSEVPSTAVFLPRHWLQEHCDPTQELGDFCKEGGGGATASCVCGGAAGREEGGVEAGCEKEWRQSVAERERGGGRKREGQREAERERGEESEREREREKGRRERDF